jgi:hypothetical protein
MSTSIKTGGLLTFFEQFTQTLVKAMGSQGNKVKSSIFNYNSSAQAQMQPKLFLVFSVVSISLVNVWYVNLISPKRYARGLRRKGHSSKWPILSTVNLSKNNLMNVTSII